MGTDKAESKSKAGEEELYYVHSEEDRCHGARTKTKTKTRLGERRSLVSCFPCSVPKNAQLLNFPHAVSQGRHLSTST